MLCLLPTLRWSAAECATVALPTSEPPAASIVARSDIQDTRNAARGRGNCIWRVRPRVREVAAIRGTPFFVSWSLVDHTT